MIGLNVFLLGRHRERGVESTTIEGKKEKAICFFFLLSILIA
jgi:hypothetical protein